MSRVIAVVACGFTLAACSSMSMPSWDFLKSAPQTEALRIESEPPGADAKATSGQECRTPCELTVPAGSEFSVTLALNGYQPQTVSVRPEAPAAGSRDANGGGFGGVAHLAPNPIYAELTPAGPAGPSPKKHAKKKKPVAAVQPATPPPTTTASAPTAAPPPPMPAAPAPAESAASATNYPWPSR